MQASSTGEEFQRHLLSVLQEKVMCGKFPMRLARFTENVGRQAYCTWHSSYQKCHQRGLQEPNPVFLLRLILIAQYSLIQGWQQL